MTAKDTNRSKSKASAVVAEESKTVEQEQPAKAEYDPTTEEDVEVPKTDDTVTAETTSNEPADFEANDENISMLSEDEASDAEGEDASQAKKEKTGDSSIDQSDVDKEKNSENPVDEYAEKSTRECYIGSLTFGISETEVRNLCKSYGTINSVKMMKGFAFVVFDARESALACTKALNETQYDGRTLRVNVCSDRKATEPSKQVAPSENKKIVVRNLSFDTTEETIRKMLKNCGVISECTLPSFEDSGRNRGWAIVTFASSDSVERALALGTMSIDGRMVRVEMHYPREQRDGRFGSPKFGRHKRPFSNERSGGYRGGDRNQGGNRRPRFDRDGPERRSPTPYMGKKTTFSD